MNAFTTFRHIATASGALFIVLSAYFLVIYALGDSRMADGRLGNEEMNSMEGLLMNLTLLGILAAWVYSIYHAFNRKRNTLGICCILFIPASFYYYWKFKDECEP